MGRMPRLRNLLQPNSTAPWIIRGGPVSRSLPTASDLRCAVNIFESHKAPGCLFCQLMARFCTALLVTTLGNRLSSNVATSQSVWFSTYWVKFCSFRPRRCYSDLEIPGDLIVDIVGRKVLMLIGLSTVTFWMIVETSMVAAFASPVPATPNKAGIAMAVAAL
jgi:hypothetical protein